jgi:hypothetical protein
MTNQAIAESIFERIFSNIVPSSKQTTEETILQAKMLYDLFRYDKVKEIREVLENAGQARSVEHVS